jgi:hypothetical protein
MKTASRWGLPVWLLLAALMIPGGPAFCQRDTLLLDGGLTLPLPNGRAKPYILGIQYA